MRIAIDLQGIQSDGSRKRGIGRYSIELLKSILSNFTKNEYILCANASLKDLTILFAEELISINPPICNKAKNDTSINCFSCHCLYSSGC